MFPGSNLLVSLDNLLPFLLKDGSPKALWLFRELVCWLGWVFECGTAWANASTNPLDIPVPRGHHRAQRLHPELLNAVGRTAGEGVLARTGAKVARVLKFAFRRRGRKQGLAERTANEGQKIRAKRYRANCQEDWGSRKVRVVSVSMDEARISGKDTMISTLYSPALDLACVGDPMAWAVVFEGAQAKSRVFQC